MKIANISSHGLHWHDGKSGSPQQVADAFKALVWNTAPKNIGRGLIQKGLVSSFAEWRLWGFPTTELSHHGLPLWFFHTADGLDTLALERHLENTGEPDLLWVEGTRLPPVLKRIFDICPGSRRIVYPKYFEPWIIEGIDLYDVCLVDEPWQCDEMRHRCPQVRTAVWDKLVDYENAFFPIPTRKKYDICYVSRLHGRKNHRLLFDALSRLRDRQLSVALVGSNEWNMQQYIEPMAHEAGAQVFFTGSLSARGVNQAINESRMGVICDRHDAVPRAMLEYMAADIPVLVNEQMRAGTRYVGPKAGLVRPPETFHEGIVDILDHLGDFRPREHLLGSYSQEQVVDKFWGIVSALPDHGPRT